MGKLNHARMADHGRHIFVYCHIQTNQVLYSLTRSLRNNASLRQLPFLGKKSVPAALRKDLWQPLATISFPHPPSGLQAFHRLREYRKLHELSYPLEDMRDKDRPNAMLPKKKRGRLLMDQKANSVADIAAVLTQQEKGSQKEVDSPAIIEPSTTLQPSTGRSRQGTVEAEPSNVQGVEGVTIAWRSLFDAEYAERWPEAVVHDELRYDRHTIGPPPTPAS